MIKRQECRIEIEAEIESDERIDIEQNAHDTRGPLAQAVLRQLQDLIQENAIKKTVEMNMIKTREDVIEAETVVEIVIAIRIGQTHTKNITDISFQINFSFIHHHLLRL